MKFFPGKVLTLESRIPREPSSYVPAHRLKAGYGRLLPPMATSACPLTDVCAHPLKKAAHKSVAVTSRRGRYPRHTARQD